MQTAFNIHLDPGHGWLEVPSAVLADLGLNAIDFTRCSYIGNAALYLEEDCDAPKFLRIYEARYGRPTLNEKHANRNSFIRSLPANKDGKWQPFA